MHSKIVILFVFLFVVPGLLPTTSKSEPQDPAKTTQLTSEQIYQEKCAMVGISSIDDQIEAEKLIEIQLPAKLPNGR